MNKQIVKSEFKLDNAIGIIGISIALIGLVIWMGYVWYTDMKEIGLFQRIMITFFPLLVTPLVLKVELPKVKILTIYNNGITLRTPIIGIIKDLKWNEIDGYQTIVHITRYGPLKELMLISRGKVIHEISENYIKNYSEVKRALTRNLKNLGPVDFNYFSYLKQRLFN